MKENHMTRSLATAAEVRNWLVSHPKSLARLSTKAQATVVPNDKGQFPKGRLSPEASEAFNKGQRKAEYVLGATKVTVAAQRKAAVAARKAATRKASRKGIVIGARGPLPKAFAPKG
jgi:hypothetical protein